MSSINELINKLKDSATALVYLPVGTGDKKRLDCIYKKLKAPHFRLIFPPGTLPVDQIDSDSQFQLSVKQENTSVTLNARLESVEDDRSLRVIGVESVRPELLREYFRVTFRAPITASYEPNPGEKQSRSWELTGETVDLSGGGVLTILPEEPKNRHRIRLQLKLSDKKEPLHCVARVIRSRRLRKKRYRVAFHFVKICSKTRDKIISFCLQEQRRQLRNKVRVD